MHVYDIYLQARVVRTKELVALKIIKIEPGQFVEFFMYMTGFSPEFF